MEKGFCSTYTQKIMHKVLLPLVAFVLVFVGLIALEPPLTGVQLDEKQRQEMMNQIESESKQLLEQLGKLERNERMLNTQISRSDEILANHPELELLHESIRRVKETAKRQKKVAEKEIAGVEEEMRSLERKVMDWVRTAYNLSPDALPPGYLARLLWKADGTAIIETTKLAQDLRATLHISRPAAQRAALRLSSILRSGKTRRTLVSAAAALATLALIESAEPLFGWIFDRWWKVLVSAAAGLLALGGIMLLQKRKVFD